MIQPTQPPKVKDKRLLVVPFVYAAGLAVLALTQLVGFGGFDFAGVKLETHGVAWAVILVAASEIFALPFLLRLSLSRLARALSALLALVAPLLYLANAIFIRDQVVAPITLLELTIGATMGILAIISFNILRGEEAIGLSKASK